jgi:uncharacterized membrane protein YfcA
VTGWELGLVGLAALVIGISKTSVGGFAAMAVAVFATVHAGEGVDGRGACCCSSRAMSSAVARYRRSADWGLLRRLLPSVLPGVALGAVFLWAVSDLALRRTIGGLIAAMVLVQVWQRWRSRRVAGEAAAERGPRWGLRWASRWAGRSIRWWRSRRAWRRGSRR